MANLYERVVLVRPVHLDFTGDVMAPGAEATVVDLLDDGVVLLEFDFDLDKLELVGAPQSWSTIATVYDFIPIPA